MSEKLKQCPFCKGEFAFDFEAKNFRCGTCGATVPPDPYARTVNTRPIEDVLITRIDRLKGEIGILEDQQREAANILIDKNLHIVSLYEKSYKLQQRIAELEGEVTKGHELQDSYCDRIAELEAERRWHVVADGDLPNTYKPVLTVDMSEATRIPVPAFYNLDTNYWYTRFEYDLWVTHWMPLPESPNDTQLDALVYGKESEE